LSRCLNAGLNGVPRTTADLGPVSMTRSRKLGIVSTVLLGSIFVPPFPNWREPVSLASVGVSGVLGLLAAQQGSKWWLVIPCIIVTGFVIGLYFAAHSF
jgi:hypothetical protein